MPTINLPLVADAIDPAAGEALEQSAYGLMVSEDPAPATRPQPLEAPSEDPGPHLSYAIQWILFAIMGFVFIGYVIRTERAHRREEAEDAARGRGRGDRRADRARSAAPSRPRTPKTEDALVDSTRRADALDAIGRRAADVGGCARRARPARRSRGPRCLRRRPAGSARARG